MNSNRKNAVDAIMTAARNVAGGGYKVYRGAVDWTQHDFCANRNGMAVIVNEQPLLVDEGVLTMTIEAYSKLRTAGNLDDAALDEKVADMVALLVSAAKVIVNGRPVILDIVDGKALEAVDFEALQIEGIVATFEVKF